MSEKRKRITLNSDDMPDEVYDILNEKALKRKVTPFIIEIVQQRIKDKSILDKLITIESKLDMLASGNTIIRNKKPQEEQSLMEGKVVHASLVISEIDEEDKTEYDF